MNGNDQGPIRPGQVNVTLGWRRVSHVHVIEYRDISAPGPEAMDRRQAKGRQSGREAADKNAVSGGIAQLRASNSASDGPCHCGDIGLRIRADGVWLYRESPITREALVRLFAGVLRKEEDGRTYLVTPVEKVDVAVEDAPFLAVAVRVDGVGRKQELTFETNIGDIVACGGAHPLRFARAEPGDGLKPYVLVRNGLEALVTRALVYDLVELAITETIGGRRRLGVWSRGSFFAMEID